MANADARARNWCFTLNNYTPEESKIMHDLSDKANYLVIGKEIGDEKKTPHLQGYIEYPNAVRMSALKKIVMRWDEEVKVWKNAVHWEVRKGTAEQAAQYCKKDCVFTEIGKLSAQGRRTDLEEIGAAVKSGDSIREIAATFPGSFIKYSKGIQALRSALLPNEPRDPNKPPKVVWLWGLAGTGKTKRAYESHKSVYMKTTAKWWDGYEQQEAIIIDDFSKKEWDFREFLRVLDRYPCKGEVKGGIVEINSPFIYITCEYPPSSLWGDPNEREQVERRIRQGGGCIEEIKTNQVPYFVVPVEESKTD